MNKITPFLWFNDNAEEAITFYMSIFRGGTLSNVSRYGKGALGKEGTIMGATFELEGQTFYALNGGPHYKFTEAISMFVNCEGQGEVDELWQKLSEGGSEGRCGWLKDKFGLSWQVIPTVLGKLMGDKDRIKAGNVMQAMMKMNKIVISELEAAYNTA